MSQARSRDRLQTVVDGLAEAVVAVDEDGHVTSFNAAAEEMTGIDADHAWHVAAAAVIRGRTEDGEDLADRLQRPSTTPWSALATVEHCDGAEVSVALTATPLRGSADEVEGAVIVLRDLTKEHEVERMKTELLSRISHELRTPLTGIIGYAELLTRQHLPKGSTQGYHEEILRHAMSLLRKVEMLEFVASAEAGDSMLRPERVDVCRLAHGVAARWASRLQPGRITTGIEVDAIDVTADPRWLEFSLDELIGNAVEFSPGAEQIAMTVKAVTRVGGSGVEIAVVDRGEGMADADIERSFGDFVQGDTSDTRLHGGLGLGLPLVKRVVEDHGGTVTVVSGVGLGSTVTILLSRAPDRALPRVSDVCLAAG